ncbi:hypothetical protein LCGC14_0428300 [marine sediment metagenome]|uniref:Phosphoadenosine phosphosulphate reductase domain-containing protein n=1 Tax=marine sediment metagenome TaxID=412755 RepID=A0A0F9SNQ1_9ZZZZ
MLKILSLGAGVQSSTLIEMSEVGLLPRVDAAIFADTGWETPATYKHLEWLEQNISIPIYRVSKGNLREDQRHAIVRGKKADGERYASLPLYVKSGSPNGGMIRRQCTREYKIESIQKKLRELAGLKPYQRAKGILVEQWFGISADESSRMRDSNTKWIENRYPLVFDLKHPFIRRDCKRWSSENGFPPAPRSACIGCPYHNDNEWRNMKNNEPESFADAVEFDQMIRRRDKRRSETFLHRSLTPLGKVDFRTAEDMGQENMFINECEGMCGL